MVHNVAVKLAGRIVERQEGVDECRQSFGTERAQAYTEVQLRRGGHAWNLCEHFGHSALGIFGRGEIVGDIHVPPREALLDGFYPLRNAGLAGVDFLPSAYEAHYRGPILALVERPNEKRRLRHGKVRHLELVAIRPTVAEVVGYALVGPGALGFVEDGHMLHFGITGVVGAHGFVRVDFESAVDNGVLGFGKHVVAIAAAAQMIIIAGAVMLLNKPPQN